MLGHYYLEQELGAGAMGIVYFGRDADAYGRVVAIKTVTQANAVQALSCHRLHKTLHHPNIVQIFESGEQNNLTYIAMEFAHGRDLSYFSQAHTLLPLAKVIEIIIQVAEALAYAHQLGVVHRDIKPANIMYDPYSGTVKIMDFGIARTTTARRIRTGILLGTPSYMSPEQLEGRHVDGRSDLFSLGITFYQLACGRLPFEGESVREIVSKIDQAPPQDIRQFNAHISDKLVEILDRALEKDPDLRYQSGLEMATALRKQ